MSSKIGKIVVTGGGGYLGSVLVPLLLDSGYEVRVIDRFFFGKQTLTRYIDNKNLELVEADTRWYSKDLLSGIDAVLDLAALSNDPSSELDPQRTFDINTNARIRTAKLAKEMGVKRYILASSCSVYGFQEGMLNENSMPAPLTTYAKASLMAEQGILPLSNDKFTVTVLRQGTLYGLSSRMRFDLVVNTMALSLHNHGKVVVQSGEQWRPLLFVGDSARAFLLTLESPEKKVNNQIFNVGSTDQNFQIEKLARDIVNSTDSSAPVDLKHNEIDSRSYRVSCDKIRDVLGFHTLNNPGLGSSDVYLALKNGKISPTLRTKTIDWYKMLIEKHHDFLDNFISSEVLLSGIDDRKI